MRSCIGLQIRQYGFSFSFILSIQCIHSCHTFPCAGGNRSYTGTLSLAFGQLTNHIIRWYFISIWICCHYIPDQWSYFSLMFFWTSMLDFILFVNKVFLLRKVIIPWDECCTFNHWIDAYTISSITESFVACLSLLVLDMLANFQRLILHIKLLYHDKRPSIKEN